MCDGLQRKCLGFLAYKCEGRLRRRPPAVSRLGVEEGSSVSLTSLCSTSIAGPSSMPQENRVGLAGETAVLRAAVWVRAPNRSER